MTGSSAGAIPGWKGSWASPVALGVLIGIATGLVEVGILSRVAAPLRTREIIFEASILYLVPGAVLGLLVLAAFALLFRRPPSGAFSGAFLLSSFGFFMTAGYVNRYYLPPTLSVVSLGATAAMLVAFLAVGFGLYRLFAFLFGGRTGSGWGTGTAWLVGIAVVAVSALVSYLPLGGEARMQGAARPSSNINVVFILVDALRYDHLSVNGYERETTPNIDRWARESVLFDGAVAQAPWTKPSVASIMTGMYAASHGVNRYENGLPESLPTLPELVKRSGYHTALFTLNCFVSGESGFQRGVDHYRGRAQPRFTRVMLGLALRFLKGELPFLEGLHTRVKAAERRLMEAGKTSDEFWSNGKLTDSFLLWLDENAEEPFFAYLHFMGPHTPYSPPAPYDKSFMPDGLERMDKVRHPPYHGLLPFYPAPAVSADSLQNMLALYDGEILRTDASVGRILDALKEKGAFDRTLIIVTADHGEAFSEHGGWGHGNSLFQELLHVPLMMSCPAVFQGGGRRIPHVVRHVDILPTILEVCEADVPDGVDGASLMPVLLGEEPPDPPRTIMSETYDHKAGFARALLRGTEKIIVSEKGDEKHVYLFDLADDPGERINLADAQPERARELLGMLEEFHAIAVEKAAAGYVITIDEDTREQMRALGYIQ